MAYPCRLDHYLFDKGYFESRQKAQVAIMAGDVLIADKVISKSGYQVKKDPLSDLRIKEKMPYVSRGGLKLEKALQDFEVDVKGKTCLDVGSSTGGFTDCLLQKGAAEVTCVDSGSNQLHYKLRSHEQIRVFENYNARFLKASDLERERFDIIVMDVSFISIRLLLPALLSFMDSETSLISLIKPQFEAGKDEVEKHGRVSKRKSHESVAINIFSSLEENTLQCKKWITSPIKGGKSENIEYLAHIVQGESKVSALTVYDVLKYLPEALVP